MWWGMADTHPYTLRYLPCFFHAPNHMYDSSKLSTTAVIELPIAVFTTVSTSGLDAWALGLDLRMKRFQPLTTHFVSCTILHGFLHGDTETTTDRGQLWLGAIWYVTVIYCVCIVHTYTRYCTSTYLYIISQT